MNLREICRECSIGFQDAKEILKGIGKYDEINLDTEILDRHCNHIREHTTGPRLSLIIRRDDPFGDNPIANKRIADSYFREMQKDNFIISFPKRYILFERGQVRNGLQFWFASDFEINKVRLGDNVLQQRLPPPSGIIYIKAKADTASSRTPAKKKCTERKPLSPKEKSSPKLKKQKPKLPEVVQTPVMHKTPKVTASTQLPVPTGDNSNSLVRNIWHNHISIMEKIVRQRCRPIPVNSETLTKNGNKLYVEIDGRYDYQRIAAILKNYLEVEDYADGDEAVVVDEQAWLNLSESELLRLQEELNSLHVEIDISPTIVVDIDLAEPFGNINMMSMAELQRLDRELNKNRLITGSICDKVTFITRVSVLREEYMRYLFGDHYVVREETRDNSNDVRVKETIEYQNQYLSNEVLSRYSHFNLKLYQYTIAFRVSDSVANVALQELYDCYSMERDEFVFVQKDIKDLTSTSCIQEIQDNITTFMHDASVYCSTECIEVNTSFVYTVSKREVVMGVLNGIYGYIANRKGYSFNNQAGLIGIDFNWRRHDVMKDIAELERSVEFVKVNLFEEHRFKCKVNLHLADFKVLKQRLTEKYDSITLEEDHTNHRLRIRLSYDDLDAYDLLKDNLQEDLAYLSDSGLKVTFADHIDRKVRLNLRYDIEPYLSDIKNDAEELLQVPFGVDVDGREVQFGKLVSCDDGRLTFDITDDNKEVFEVVEELLLNGSVEAVIPIMTGELEKLSRLRTAMERVVKGERLINPRLQNFIFDASHATPTPDIDIILNPEGNVYKELSCNLLNDHINESQKEAILKAMYADDLAVIQGPPGTGKSTAIAELIWQLVRNGFRQGNKQERILLTSETNLAVDNAIARIVNNRTNLVKPIRLGSDDRLEAEGLQFSLEMMDRWVEIGDEALQVYDNEAGQGNNLILKNWLSNIARRSFDNHSGVSQEVIDRWHRCLSNPSRAVRELVRKHYVEHANVVGATCSSIGDKKADKSGQTPFYKSYIKLFGSDTIPQPHIEFTTVIQDESSKATPAELVLPFVYGRRAIAIGDHRQLPPMLDREDFEETIDYALSRCRNAEDKAEMSNLRRFVDSHFEEMEISHFQKMYEQVNPSLKATFNMQYRMHPHINDVICQFYKEDGGLKCGLHYPDVDSPNMQNPVSRYHGIDIPGLIDKDTHILFINSNSPEMHDGTSRVNPGEVEVVDRLLSLLENSASFQNYLSKFDREEDRQIGVISFYGKQVSQLRAVAQEHASLPLRVSTVDRFQGMERNIVIVSMVRSHIIQRVPHQQPDMKRYPQWGFPTQHSVGFAQSPNRLNVALSRAKRLLIIIGNKTLFSSKEIYRNLFEEIEANPSNKFINQDEL